MARLSLGIVTGIAVGIVAGAAFGIHAQQQPTEEARSWAEQTGADPIQLEGALSSVREVYPGLSAEQYLASDGLLQLPDNPAPQVVLPACDWPICGPLGKRLFCIEAIESVHGRYMWNPQGWPPPTFHEHAQGWLGWLPSTARHWGVAIGDRVSEWAGAARMLAAGAGSQFFGVAAGRC